MSKSSQENRQSGTLLVVSVSSTYNTQVHTNDFSNVSAKLDHPTVCTGCWMHHKHMFLDGFLVKMVNLIVHAQSESNHIAQLSQTPPQHDEEYHSNNTTTTTTSPNGNHKPSQKHGKYFTLSLLRATELSLVSLNWCTIADTETTEYLQNNAQETHVKTLGKHDEYMFYLHAKP